MSAVADPIKGLTTFLKADATIAALVAARVFGEELPKSETASMPRKCIVVEPSGPGSLGGGYQEYGDLRVDLRCYGETPYEARRLQRAAYGALKALRRKVHSGVLLHWAIRSGGPIGLRDPDTDWPFVFESYQVLVAEVEVA